MMAPRNPCFGRFAVGTLAAVVVFLFSQAALAWDNGTAGTIVYLHLNSDIPGRGLFVTMNPGSPPSSLPSLPGTAWLCLSAANPLYKEIAAELQIAFITQETC